MASENITRQLSIFINDREVKNSLNGITSEMRRTQAIMRGLNKGNENYNEQLKELQDHYEQLRTKQSYFKDELFGLNSTIDESNNSLAGVKSQMRSVSAELETLDRTSENYATRVNELAEEYKRLEALQIQYQAEIAALTATEEEHTEAIETSANSLVGIKNQMNAVSAEMAALDRTSENYTERINELGAEYRELAEQQQRYENEIEQATRAQRVHTNSLEGVEQQMGEVRQQMRGLDRDQENYREELARLQQEYAGLEVRQEAFNEEINGTSEELGEAGSAFSNLFNGLATGNLTMAASGFTAMKGAIIATTKAAFAFVGSGIGLAIASLAGIALATREWYNYNKEVAKANSETAAITKLSGDALNDARIRSQVLAERFEQDQQELLETARAMVNEFDISYTEAFDSIEKGFIKGGAASDEFLESLQEYPTFFSQAGFGVEEFQNLINTGIDLGIYQDKLPDAIKEFALSVQEQTPAVRDALYNAFGPEFTDKLLAGVKDGSVTVKDALVQVSEEAKRLGLNVQQSQQLTADLFRGAGEDAGGAIKIFDAVTDSLENQNAVLSEADQAVKDLTESEYHLARAKDMALNSEGFSIWSNRFDQWVNNIKAGFYQVLFTLTNSKEELEKLIEDDVENRSSREWAKMELDTFKDYVARRKKSMGELYDFEVVKEEFMDTVRQQKAKAETEYDKKKLQAGLDAIENYQERVKVTTNKFNIDDLNAQKKANDQKRKEWERRQAQDKKDREKAAEDAAKARVEEYKKLAKANLEYYVASHSSAVDADKKLTQEIIAEEKKRLDALAIEKMKVVGIEKQTNDAIIAIKRSQNIDLNSADVEYLTSKLQLETENHKAIAELNKQYDEEQKTLKAEQLQADNELALAEAESQDEADRILREQKYQEEVEAYKKMLDNKIITKQQYDRFVAALDKDKEETERLARIKKAQDTLNEMGRLADALTAMFGQSKEAAIAQAAINGGLAVTEILASKSVLPHPLNYVSKMIQISGVIATVGKNISQIQSTKAPKRAKFFYGGSTGTAAALGHDEYGPVTGVVHKNEYVIPEAMTQQPRYANVIGWLERERQKLPGYYYGGSASGSTQVPVPAVSAPEADSAAGELATAVNRLSTILESGINARAVFGYQQLEELNTMNDELKASNQNGKLNT